VVDPATRSEELMVEEALEKKPLNKPSVVEVACIVPEVTNGYELPQPVQEVTVRFPMAARLARRLVDEAIPETKREVEVASDARRVVMEVEPMVEEAVIKFVVKRLVEFTEAIVP
jgi:hypothetical protein